MSGLPTRENKGEDAQGNTRGEKARLGDGIRRLGATT